MLTVTPREKPVRLHIIVPASLYKAAQAAAAAAGTTVSDMVRQLLTQYLGQTTPATPAGPSSPPHQ